MEDECEYVLLNCSKKLKIVLKDYAVLVNRFYLLIARYINVIFWKKECLFFAYQGIMKFMYTQLYLLCRNFGNAVLLFQNSKKSAGEADMSVCFALLDECSHRLNSEGER